MALKNYIAKSLYLGKRFKRSIAHNNLKLNLQHFYHIQVFRSSPSSRQSQIQVQKKQCVRYRCSKILPISFLIYVFVLFLEVCEWGSEEINMWGRVLFRDVRVVVVIMGGVGGWEYRVFLNNLIFEKHLVHTTTINFNS